MITPPIVHVWPPLPALASFVFLPNIAVVPAGPRGPVVFQDSGFVPLGHVPPAFRRMLRTPLLLFSHAWMVVPFALGAATDAAAAAPPDSRMTAPMISARGRTCQLRRFASPKVSAFFMTLPFERIVAAYP